MLDLDTRTAILTLARRGHGIKRIARSVGVSKNSVRSVLRSGRREVGGPQRPEQLTPHLELVREQHVRCQGNLVRVHEELEARLAEKIAYSTLTAFCRRQGIGHQAPQAAGRYHFAPGQEMQHDTSPHTVEVGGRARSLQCASLILCYSRRIYAQCYPRWTRFEARVFLSEAVHYLGGAAGKCMLDNSTVIIAQGTGKDAVPAAEMAALATRFGFEFIAHEVGDANRSGRVERPFDYIENNFYPGRDFADLADLNRQFVEWCVRSNRRHRRHLGCSPLELFATEQPALRPLPVYIPEVYALHRRRIDVEGYANLHTNRYSVDAALIGKDVEVRETLQKVRLFDGHRLAAEHTKLEYGARLRTTLPEHRGQWRRRVGPPRISESERLLRGQGDELGKLIDTLKKRYGGQAKKAVLRLERIWKDYPTEAVTGAISVALEYGLTDLERIERMVLRRIAGDFFKLPVEEDDDG